MAVWTSIACTAIAWAGSGEPAWEVELETGATATRYNYAQVPRATGTRIDLAGLVGRDARLYARASLLYRDGLGGTWKLLYAPLSQSGTGVLASASSFDGTAFAAGAVDATYRFNSYRLTYRKLWKGAWSIGGTLKVRDAEIRLVQGGLRASESNVGLVPLLNVHGTGDLGRGLSWEIEMDGLAGGPGRAFDISLRLVRSLDAQARAFVGYRLLEGGADVPRVKNFAWVDYFSAGVAYRF